MLYSPACLTNFVGKCATIQCIRSRIVYRILHLHIIAAILHANKVELRNLHKAVLGSLLLEVRDVVVALCSAHVLPFCRILVAVDRT